MRAMTILLSRPRPAPGLRRATRCRSRRRARHRPPGPSFAVEASADQAWPLRRTKRTACGWSGTCRVTGSISENLSRRIMFHPVFRIAGCQTVLAGKTEGGMVVDQAVGDPVIAMVTHGVAKDVKRLLCRLRRLRCVQRSAPNLSWRRATVGAGRSHGSHPCMPRPDRHPIPGWRESARLLLIPP